MFENMFFIEELQNIINSELLGSSEKWVLGDFNIDSLKLNHPHSSFLRKFCRDNVMTDLITGVTRPGSGGGGGGGGHVLII